MENTFHSFVSWEVMLLEAGGSDSKMSARNAGNTGSTPGSGRSHGEENGNPLQYSCLENSMDRGTWWANSPWGRKEWDATK